MQDAAALRQIKSRYRALAPLMDERMRRQWAASEAQTYGRGGVSALSSATGMSRNTIRKGLIELAARKKHPRAPVATRLRKQGGGRKRAPRVAACRPDCTFPIALLAHCPTAQTPMEAGIADRVWNLCELLSA